MNFWTADSSGMDDTTRLPFWLGNVLLTLVIVFVVWRLLQRHGLTWTDRRWQAAMIAALLLGVLSQEVSGISIGMTLLILGFAHANRVLMGIAIAALLYFISRTYYYYLGATLAGEIHHSGQRRCGVPAAALDHVALVAAGVADA
ncbi:MAG: DUF4401 domain-containing protein [Gammaproteobacteria bacterium]